MLTARAALSGSSGALVDTAVRAAALAVTSKNAASSLSSSSSFSVQNGMRRSMATTQTAPTTTTPTTAPIATASTTTAKPKKHYDSSTPFLAPSNSALANQAKPVYLDYQATTPIDPRVLKKMWPALTSEFGNAHSRTHAYGWEAERLTEEARGQVASLIGAEPREIVFTSGATESNNLAIKGIAGFYGKARGKKHMITVQTEHKCVLASANHLQHELGWDVTFLPVHKDGLIDPADVEKAIRPDTGLVSIMLVNNEIGVIQPLKEIAEICRKHKVFVHTDAAQAVGKIPIDVNDLGVDLMSISGHKIYGPKGIGALYVRARPRVRLAPQMSGGGQERGLRSGTLPVPLCVGLGAAAEICGQDMEKDSQHIKRLFDRFYHRVTSKLEKVSLNGSMDKRYYGSCNLSFACVEGESLLMAMQNVAVSSGSACTSASLEPSYVLRALGVDEDIAHSSIRFGLGRFTTQEECDLVADAVVEAVHKLRDISPLWEIEQEGGDKAAMTWT